jgi:hypothetical protein
MLRSIGGVVVGYVALFIVTAGLFMTMWFGLGPDQIFEPGTFHPNIILNIGAPAISVLGALLGGWVCAKVSRSRKAVIALASIVLIVGLVAAYFTLQKPEPGARDPKWTAKETMDHGREPNWYALANPFIGCFGILLGGMCVCGCGKKPS